MELSKKGLTGFSCYGFNEIIFADGLLRTDFERLIQQLCLLQS